MAGHYVEVVVDKAKGRVLKATIIISLQVREHNAIEALGSGVLLRIDGDIFLVTAAHILNHENWHLLVIPGVGDSMITLQGEMCSTYMANNESNIDFAVLKLYPKMHKYLERYVPLESNEIAMNHKLIATDNYLVSGFPVRKISKRKENEILVYTADPLTLLTFNASKKRYSKHNFDDQTHILVQFQQKLKAFGSSMIIRVVNPQGISGSGLYYLPAFNKPQSIKPDPALIGIMIENHKDKGFMAAIRIDAIIEVVRSHFTMNNIDLPSTQFEFHLGNVYNGDYTENLESEEKQSAL